jgi:hypothetical protein
LKNRKFFSLFLVVCLILSLALVALASPTVYPGNLPPADENLAECLSFKIDPEDFHEEPEDDLYYDGMLRVVLSYNAARTEINFQVVGGGKVCAVWVKGGPNGGHLYDYRPDGTFSGTGLTAPPNRRGILPQISHVTFYYMPYTPEEGKSSLNFVNGQTGYDDGKVWAVIVNGGDEGMTGTVAWELYYAPSGNPKFGTIVATGTVPKLAKDQQYTMEYATTTAGNYMFKAYQEAWHPGSGVLWSEAITVPVP